MTGSTHKGCNTGKERIVHLVVQKVHRGWDSDTTRCRNPPLPGNLPLNLMCGAWLKEGGADVEGLQKPIWHHDMLSMTWEKDQSILFFRKRRTRIFSTLIGHKQISAICCYWQFYGRCREYRRIGGSCLMQTARRSSSMQTKRGDVGRKTHHFLRTGSYH